MDDIHLSIKVLHSVVATMIIGPNIYEVESNFKSYKAELENRRNDPVLDTTNKTQV